MQFDWWAIDGYPTYVAAKLWLSGHSESMYNAQLWVHDGGNLHWKKQMAVLGVPNSGTAFLYHPVYVLALSPLVDNISLDQFTYLLVFLNATSLGVVVAESIRLSGDVEERRRLVAGALACAAFPALYSAYLGQNVLPTLAFIMLGWRFSEKGSTFLCIFSLVIATIMKVWVLPVVIVVLSLHGSKFLLRGFLVLLLCLVVLPFVFFPKLFIIYIDVVSRFSDITVYPLNNVSLRSFLERIGGQNWIAYALEWKPHFVSASTRQVEIGVRVLVGGGAVFLWRRFRPSSQTTFMASLCLLLLLPGVCWSHYYVFAIPVSCFLFLKGSKVGSMIGLASLVFLALPWNSIPGGVIREWPPRSVIIEHPYLVAVVYAVPFVWFSALAMISLGYSRFFVPARTVLED